MRAKPGRLQRRTVAESRDGLQRVLEAIRQGELTATPGYMAHLQGAIAALDALLGDHIPPGLEDT
ncbi:MAG TPA: hypothetical protein VMV12_01865 [Candidatus Micrarchaeaceae archaeon]|nr:hypothetical protein [Candidatus Micrarchaeaceae archaeon]